MKALMGLGLFFGLALAASAVEIKSDWSIVYADKSVGADGCTECALRRTAEEIAIDFEEATGWKLKFRPYIRFRLLSGCGRVEVEDVTLEELGK